MLKSEIQEVHEIARAIAKEEIAKALAHLRTPIADIPLATETEGILEPVRSHHKKP